MVGKITYSIDDIVTAYSSSRFAEIAVLELEKALLVLQNVRNVLDLLKFNVVYASSFGFSKFDGKSQEIIKEVKSLEGKVEEEYRQLSTTKKAYINAYNNFRQDPNVKEVIDNYKKSLEGVRNTIAGRIKDLFLRISNEIKKYYEEKLRNIESVGRFWNSYQELLKKKESVENILNRYVGELMNVMVKYGILKELGKILREMYSNYFKIEKYDIYNPNRGQMTIIIHREASFSIHNPYIHIMNNLIVMLRSSILGLAYAYLSYLENKNPDIRNNWKLLKNTPLKNILKIYELEGKAYVGVRYIYIKEESTTSDFRYLNLIPING